ncbi:phage virion morphogenesis protein [Sphingomonas sp. PP-F2F-G114-C0414]|uniref:phage virion morphogenesis protein n=1 Tax=Sphingomonas sp. PP-F2F-G114-C0414 TaxID=2135662 RepID=UPI000EF87F21|nr:phage virion morphogenesis protein [Sphingomonas sp. PP-F2F-G114-C0414]RMB26250.1 phage virion morphogenesis protein [Sphingomonas sp. PP-F2F-G114-C0414]
MNDFAPIEQLCRDLLLRTAAPERARLMRSIGREIRKSQSDRIAAQRDPDGAAFVSRRPKPDRGKKGRLRQQKMFRKLRMAKSLKAGGNADEAWVGFAGRASRIASIHQEGLSDAPAPGQAKVRYARRVLLGLTEAEQQRILDLILAQVTAR